MPATIIDGKSISEQIMAEVARDVAALKARNVTPGLAVIIVGDDPASLSYVSGKEKACARLGMQSEILRLPTTTQMAELLKAVDGLNRRPEIHGLLVQSPLPGGLDEGCVIEAIDPRKDVDGFHPLNIGRMLAGQDSLLPCTPAGIVEMLLRSGHDPCGRHAVIVGRSNIVGRPLANLLSRKGRGGDATVTLCHSRTPNLAHFTTQADILVAAVGKPGAITAEMVKEGAVVIDVGVNRIPDASAKKGYRLVGDVDFDGVSMKAGAITPVPGGVGLMTVAMLMKNTAKAAAPA
ncbi:MAG: tetrahydrofolate dehydrogenase/cyclohydrolase catalytic domain-containing protein [Methanobacteriota archaeon]